MGAHPQERCPPAVPVPQSLGKGVLVGMQTDKRCGCLGGLAVEVGAGGGRLPSLCLPIPPVPGGPKSPPSRTKGRGGGTRPPSSTSLADKCHLHHLLQHVKCGGRAVWQRGAGTASPWEEAQPLWSGDTDTGHQVPVGTERGWPSQG